MPEPEGRYKGGGTVEGRWGCAAAVVAGLPVFVFLLLGETLGDCVPEAPCRKSFPLFVLLPSGLVALAAVLLIRQLVAALRRNRD